MSKQIARILEYSDVFITLTGGLGTLEKIFQISF
jgi:predicted Rossmann-fold nucleotide-binding protein